MRAVLAVLLAIAIASSGELSAQQPAAPPAAGRACSLRMLDGGVAGGTGAIINLQDPFQVTCTDGSMVQASSGVVDQTTRVVTLTGNVYFEDPSRTLTSERAVYEINLGRLHATGNVVFIDRVEGTTLRGPELEYFRVMEGRPEALVNAPGRPHLTLRRRPSGDAPPSEAAAAPLEVDADYMTIVGQNNLTATGNVLIQDPDMRAVADEAEHRGVAETLELRGNAEIHSRDYSLSGQTIFARIPGNKLQEVEARGDSRLQGTDLTVSAPILDLLFENDLLQRSIARRDTVLAPGRRPVAASPTFRLQADSIEAILPGQKLETVVAVGNARGESIDTTGAAVPDSAGAEGAGQVAAAAGDSIASAAADVIAAAGEGDSLPPSAALALVENDWIVGDTITGYFSTALVEPDSAAPDSAVVDSAAAAEDAEAVGPPVDPEVAAAEPGAAPDSTVVLERLVAVGAARSLYHVAPEAGSAPGTRPGINFLSAQVIELTFRDGQVDVADVEGLRRGLYLEPLAALAEPAEADAGADAAPAEGAGGEGEAEQPVEPQQEPQPAVEPGGNE